jgi:RNA polymerase sigma factor (sigma-70 family)
VREQRMNPPPEFEEKFQILIEDHRKILYKICNAYCRNRDDREDLAQEIVARLWQSFKNYDGRRLFSTWMYRVALNVAISFFRREQTRTRHVVPVEERLLAAVPENENQTDDLRLLYQFIDILDPLNKALILLYLDGHSYAEIAQVLGISETNTATRIGRLKKAMKEEFRGAEHGS